MKIKNKIVLSQVLVALFLGSSACSHSITATQSSSPLIGDYDYTSYDQDGSKVVTGRLTIESVENRRVGPDEVPQLKGNWEFKKAGNQQRPIGGQVGKGQLTGSIRKGEIIIDLNPGMSDANVVFTGKLEGKRLSGKWVFNGYAGPMNHGKFEAIKQ